MNKLKCFLLFGLLTLSVTSFSQNNQTITGKVERITDGDTFVMLYLNSAE